MIIKDKDYKQGPMFPVKAGLRAWVPKAGGWDDLKKTIVDATKPTDPLLDGRIADVIKTVHPKSIHREPAVEQPHIILERLANGKK